MLYLNLCHYQSTKMIYHKEKQILIIVLALIQVILNIVI